MTTETTIEPHKIKPRGRPFPKGNKKGKLLADLAKEIPTNPPEEKLAISTEKVKTILEAAGDPTTQEVSEKPARDLEIIDCVEFSNGENTLSIRFSKRHNRMFRVQIILNGETEIRPVTYTGASTGYTFWNLLKQSLKNSSEEKKS